MFNPVSLATGAISEVRAYFQHVTSTVETEFQNDRARIASLESKAAAVAEPVLQEIENEITTAVGDAKIETHHVGMSFKEVFEAVTHPFKAGKAYIAGEGRPAALEIPTEKKD